MRDRLGVQDISKGALFVEHRAPGRPWQPVQVDADHAVFDRTLYLLGEPGRHIDAELLAGSRRG
jgi:hypothetical protein